MAKKSICKVPMVKRMFSAILLGIIFAFICSSIASLTFQGAFWGSMFMWNLFYNRILVGLVIAFAGFVTFHPILKIRMYPALRGALLGAIVSLGLSFTIISANLASTSAAILGTLFTGAVIGMIIDLLATKIGGEGKDLNKQTQKK